MLTTKEFIEKVEELGYRVEENGMVIVIFKNNLYAAMTRKDEQFSFNTLYDVTEDEKLFHILVDYAQTPIDKREKKGYLWIKNVRHYKGYSLDYHPNTNELKIDYDSSYDFSLAVNAVEYTESKKEEIEKKTDVPLVFLEER